MTFYPIWLPAADYPDLQFSNFSTNIPVFQKKGRYAVAEFFKHYDFEAKKVTIRVTAASQFFLFVNGQFVGLGPASAGGDFLTEKPLPWMFENEYTLTCDGGCDIRVLVRLQPEVLTEFTPGYGLLRVEGTAGDLHFGTDETWQCRLNAHYVSSTEFDTSVPIDDWRSAQRINCATRIITAPIPMLDFEYVKGSTVALTSTKQSFVEFDRIYSAYVRISVDSACVLKLDIAESAERTSASMTLKFAEAGNFTSLAMYSVGEMTITMLDGSATVVSSLLFSHYPIGSTGHCITSDNGLNRVMDVTRWTLKLCRQTMHLDSPMHQELLACTGDYYIEMLMTGFETGDMRLADLDVRRTAMWLNENNGRMFHTTYSLIWVQMLRKLYQWTGNLDTVKFCYPALCKLLALFDSYLDENGLVTTPPDYMFVDWTVLEGYSMHHPPRALGQTVLNAFYYKALIDAAELASFLGHDSKVWSKQADMTKDAFNKIFWDADRMLYVDGLDTPDAAGRYKPENPKDLRHFSRYPQTLAALYGICPPEYTEYLTEIAADETNGLPLVQPYFMHFVLEAVIQNGLAEKYALTLLRKWIPICENCPKGLQEGWIKPQADYSFDHSHAWGGTPAYHLPLLLTGLQIVEPGFKKIHLDPKLYGLQSADISINTPFGELGFILNDGADTVIKIPSGINTEV